MDICGKGFVVSRAQRSFRLFQAFSPVAGPFELPQQPAAGTPQETPNPTAWAQRRVASRMGGHGRPHGAAASAGQGSRLRAHSPPASARRWPSARAKPPPTYLTGKQEAALVAADDAGGLLLGAIGRRRRRGQPRQLGHRLQNRRASRCAAECAPGFVRHNLYDCRRQSRENSGRTDDRILCMCVCRDLSHTRAPKKSSARLWVSWAA